MRPTLRPLALTECASALLGCPAKLPAGATALDKITIDGADDVSEGDVTDAIASQPTSKVLGLFRPWWVDYGTYDPVTVEKDLQRIERFFHARGYYEAHVRAGRVIPNGERSVRVQIVVEEGQVVNVSKVLVSGLEGLPPQVRRKVSRAWTLAPGDPFDEDKYHAAGAAFEGAFTDNGYAYATVKMGADVDLLKHEAVIHLEVVPGPVCTFGAITITGLNELTDHAVRKVLDIRPGDPYSTRTMREAQNALFDLLTFDTVNFEPDLSQPGRTEIPVKVVTVESKLRRVKAGPGFLFDPVRSDVHFIAGWEHRNFFGGLRRFSVELRPMAVLRPGFFNPNQVRPGLTGRTELRQPSFIEARTQGVIGIDGGLLPDAVNDYQTLYAHGMLGIDRRFWSILYGGLFFKKWLDNPMAYNGTQLPGNVFPAQVGFFELSLQVDARNDLLKPTKGFLVGTTIQYALAPGSGDPNAVNSADQPNGLMKTLFGDFHDVRIQPEIRLYGPLSKKITLAFRHGTGFLIPFNYTTGDPPKNTNASDPSRYASVRRGEPGYQDPPIWRTFFSGGATDNRGYPTRQVGLRDCDYAYPTSAQLAADPKVQPTQKEYGQDCSIVVGGASMWTGTVELRFDISGPFGAVLFLDASDVSRRTFDLRLDYPHLSAGPGLRYVTPVGPVRVDFGYRLPGLQRIGGQLDPRETPNDFNLGIKGPFALHFSLGEAF
jgi:outer membrane protein insertion porin family/translocation and assembly module TamA